MTGRIEPARSLSLAFRSGGRIAGREVDVGDHVRAGQVVARLESAQAEAALAAAQASVAAAEAAHDEALRHHERMTALLAAGTATRSSVDAALAGLQTAAAARDIAGASLRRAGDQLEGMVLRAPAAGIITASTASAGEIVQPGQPALVLAEDGPRDAVFDAYEVALLRVDATQPIRLDVNGNGAATYLGRVREVAPSVDEATGTVRIRVRVEGDAALLPLGALVVARVSALPQDAVVLPGPALTLDRGEPAVWIVGADDRLELRPVEVLEFGADAVAIRAGLSGGEPVVIRGPRAMWPGRRVAPRIGAPS